MVHCSLVGCKNKQANNSEVAYFTLPKEPQRRKSWLAAISRDKSNLPSNIFVCSDHFKDKYFDKSWDLQHWLFYTDRPIKRKLISTATPTMLPHKQIPTPRKSSEIRAKQKEKNFETGFGYHESFLILILQFITQKLTKFPESICAI